MSNIEKTIIYEDLVKLYGGLSVLIINGDVKFADKSNKLVFEYAKKHYPNEKWNISRIDSGDAAFYG